MATSERISDFRSDTVTRPTAGMLKAMTTAPLGDDVLGDDPTVLALQERVAGLLGKEAALFVPSGSMSNLIAIRLHCQPGDEMLCEAQCHLYHYEQGGYAQINNVAVRPVEGVQGVLRPEQLVELVRPANVHFVRTRLVTLENTHNRGGGKVQPFEFVSEISRWARDQGLRLHLDGARLWNASVATGIEPARWAACFDTVSVCFSKALGAPAGSVLAGPRDLIAQALRHRKVLGGAMRQAGILAAAGIYALDHHIERLAEDHARAQRLAAAIREIEGLSLAFECVDTNLLFFRVDTAWGTAAEMVAALKKECVLMLATGPQTIRAVLHLDVDDADVARAVAALKELMKGARVSGG
ncbi:MAG: low-specificity L-threonine aldolase [Planctomycetota bacterium]